MKFGTDIDDDEQWLSKYFKLRKSFLLSSYSSILYSDYIIILLRHGTNIHSDPLPYALSIVELLGLW